MDEDGFAIEVMGKRQSYEEDAERVMSIISGSETMRSSMVGNRSRGSLLRRLENEDITLNIKDISRMMKGGE